MALMLTQTLRPHGTHYPLRKPPCNSMGQPDKWQHAHKSLTRRLPTNKTCTCAPHKDTARCCLAPLPLTIITPLAAPAGDMDLNPLGGQYRLQAAVGPVEVNALRATLGVRPIPFPIAGALRGVLHVTGPLDKPIFSGSASALRPPPALLVGVEDTPALQALLSDPSAVVAYDRVPASAANGVFTLDTATEMFVLHSGQAVPAGGGLVQAAGRMWVAAAAEADPRAIAMEAGGSGLNAGALAKPYVLPPEVRYGV